MTCWKHPWQTQNIRIGDQTSLTLRTQLYWFIKNVVSITVKDFVLKYYLDKDGSTSEFQSKRNLKVVCFQSYVI